MVFARLSWYIDRLSISAAKHSARRDVAQANRVQADRDRGVVETACNSVFQLAPPTPVASEAGDGYTARRPAELPSS
jgi:hypothetical protein